MKDFSQYKILHNRSIREAFKKTDLNKKKFILVTNNEDEFIGIITDGDLRRSLGHNKEILQTIQPFTKGKKQQEITTLLEAAETTGEKIKIRHFTYDWSNDAKKAEDTAVCSIQ